MNFWKKIRNNGEHKNNSAPAEAQKREFLAETLEPRMLYSGAPVEVPVGAGSEEQVQEHAQVEQQ